MATYYNNFITFGLNRHRNFLNAPHNEGIDLFTDEDVQDFCCTILANYDCPESAVFVVFQDGRFEAFWKTFDEEGELCIARCESKNMHMFSEIDGEIRFCCYGLIIEQPNGMWKIQE